MSRLFPVFITFNAAARLNAALGAMGEARRRGLVDQVTVSDGGSADDTQAIAMRRRAKMISQAKGRGPQFVAAVQALAEQVAPDDWWLFLHGDTVLEPGWSAEVDAFIKRGAPEAAAFRFALDDPSARARRLAASVNWRSRVLKLPYGDQGLLIAHRLYAAIGGFKPLPLFEDVDLVRRIGRGRLAILESCAVTSAERFVREGYLLRSMKNLTLLARYYMGADPHRLARRYHQTSADRR